MRSGGCQGAARPARLESRPVLRYKSLSGRSAVRKVCLCTAASGALSASEPGNDGEEDRQDQAEQDAGSEGEVDSHVAAAPGDVAGQPSEEARQARPQQKEETDGDEDHPEDQDRPAEDLDDISSHASL